MVALSFSAHAQFSYTEEPALDIVRDIQQKTEYRFLYRESLIVNVKITFEADNGDVIKKLEEALKRNNLNVDADHDRKQVVIYKTDPSSQGKNIQISGQVIDANTGERLPFANVFWEDTNGLDGVSTNSAGAFTCKPTIKSESIVLRASYVGYSTETIRITLGNRSSIGDISLRLKPSVSKGEEVIVSGTGFYSALDKSLTQTVDIGTFSPLGESNSIRALQKLPSVQTNTGLQSGVNVRGSAADGFQVLLDGITIYNQSHLFGLLDSFNSDALKTSGLFYDVTPAQYQAPPGGTLSLLTKTGSLNTIKGTAGVSNTTYRLTLEGPLKPGSSSWLISGRNSYLNSIDWLNNSGLIELGLDVDRPREVLSPNLVQLEDRLVEAKNSDAHFFDIHSKFYFESSSGNRLILSGYYGQDNTSQNADRLFRSFKGNGNFFESRPVQTSNKWGNGAASIQYQSSISSSLFSYTTAAFSIYETDFSKDDFNYIRASQNDGSLQLFTLPFANKSILNEIKLEQSLDVFSKFVLWTVGGSYHFYKGEYFEDSFDRPGFFNQTISHKIDGFVQLDFTEIPKVDFFAGSRIHYYTNGSYLKWSPRLKAKIFPDSPVSLGAGFSRNFKFLNKVSLSNTVSSEVWVLSSDQQPPSSVDYYSAGIYIEPFANSFFQVEGYIKDYKNVRLHEINTFSLSNTFSELPWFAENDGYGQGLEFFLSNKFNWLTISQSFAISSMELQNPAINEGEPFYVDWDRRYDFSNTLEIYPAKSLSLFISWTYATGIPNKLAVFGPDNQERLGDYTRTDISFEYDRELSFGKLKASFSIYNLFDRNNPWYRELSFVVDQSASSNRLRTTPVEVFDLGFQPSFNLSVSF